LEMGRVAGGIFDVLFFREDPSTRGRTRGQIMALLKQGALQAGHEPDAIHLIRGEEEAVAASLRHAMPGDLLVVTPSMVEQCWKQVTSFEPKTARVELPMTVAA